MLFMKDMRAKVVAECTLKESAAINQILGRKVSLLTMVVALAHPWVDHTLPLFCAMAPWLELRWYEL